MKIENKYIIILIVVAVVIYLWWKNSQKAGKSSGRGSDGSTALDYNSTDSIIAHSGMNSADAAYVRNYVVSKVESDLSYKAYIEDKAIERGYTYAQMVVLDALWTKYCRMVDGVSQFKDGITDAQKSYYWTVTNKIKNL